jgi:hypothetical protein
LAKYFNWNYFRDGLFQTTEHGAGPALVSLLIIPEWKDFSMPKIIRLIDTAFWQS